jgi:spoIIIJ-associated protein
LEEIEVSVIKEGRSGILGIGAEEALISVKLLNQNTGNEDADLQVAKTILEVLLRQMGFNAAVEVKNTRDFLTESDEENPVTLNISGDDLNSLIGRRGQTLDALQYLVRLMYTRKTKSKNPIVVDVDGYKERRFADLKILALNVASQVKDKRSSVRLEPMPAYERRIIHMTLADDSEIETESIGEGESRKIVISPKSK